MPTFTASVSNLLKPHYTKITILIVAVLFLLVSWWFYINYYKNYPKDKNMNDIPNSSQYGAVELHMYYVSWCPYCKTALPVYETIKEKYKYQLVNGHKVLFVSKDITDQTNIANKAIVKKYDISSYPTIFLIDTTGKRVEYKAKVTNENLEKFLQMSAK